MNRAHSVMIRMLRPLRAPLSLLSLLVLAACGGGGGGDDDSDDGGNTPNVAVSGKITFDRVPFKLSGGGLDLSAPIDAPARLVVVEALDSSSGVVATTNTDAAGDYSLTVPSNTQIRIRAKAQMLKTGTAPTWNFRVLNNTNSDALYAVDGVLADSGASNSVRNLRATSGWNGTTYASARAAAPFAILDTVYQARTAIVGAVADTAFPALNLFWSPDNKGSDAFCPDDGDVITSLYFTFDSVSGQQDDCGNAGVEGIYVLGDFAGGNGDTDEFDQHVIAHEFGHYLEDKFSRSDSIGGDHTSGDLLDLRVAFGEGWGDAFSGMALNDPLYRDSMNGQAADTGFDMEADAAAIGEDEGWYSEGSVTQILWDLFDGGTESGDSVNLGFAPIYSAFSGAQKTTDALTSIYSFASALIAANGSSASGINALLSREEIGGTGAFGVGENNFGGKATLNPTYTPITLNGGSVQVCGTRSFGTYNKLGNRRFLQLDLAQSRAVQITAQGLVGSSPTPAPDPDVGLWHRGLVGASQEDGTTEIYNTPVLAAGTYIIEVADYTHIATVDLPARRGDSCVTVSVSGT